MDAGLPLATDTVATIQPIRAALLAAMEGRRQVTARHHRRPVRFCPHVLGRHDGQAYVLGFMVQPDPDLPAAPGSCGWLRLWQWLRLADLDEVRAVDAGWLAGPRWSRPFFRFLDQIERQAS